MFLLGIVIPVDERIGPQMQRAGGHMDHRMPVTGASFEQDDLRAVLAQPVGEHTPRGPGPDDDIIGLQIRHCTALKLGISPVPLIGRL